jgi:hypothetical protein
MITTGRRAAATRAAGVVAVALLGLLTAAERAGAAPPTDAEQQLLDRYSPVLAVRRHTSQCGDGERFRPVAVDAILGRPDVVLRDGDGDVVATAPTAADLANGPADRWIDLPGNSLDPGCSYERWAASLGAEPSIYGRVTADSATTVVQYWFFWVYNQWNDVHEGDWEMIQLDFDAPSADAALVAGPTTYAYAQHEGSEYATVGDNDGKLTLLDGTHPVVFAGQGSHAAYFSSSRWFGKSGATGFGCDDTRGPLDQIRPALIALPGDDVPTTGSLAWLSYAGHWGQQAPSFDNGPTGPVSKSQWAEPVQWVADEGRDSAVAVPFARSRATDAFCDLSAGGSALFNRLLDEPLLVLALVAIVVAIALFIVRTSSRGVLGAAARRWRRGWCQYVAVGGLVLIAAAATSVVQWILVSITPLGTLVDAVGSSSTWVLPLVTVIGSVVALPILCWAMAATLAVRSAAPSGEAPIRASLRRPGAIWAALALLLATGLGAVVFWPLLVLASRWIVGPAVASDEPGVGAPAALRRSHWDVRGHGWRSLGMLLTLLLIGGLVGLVGALLLFLTSLSFTAVDVVIAAVGVVVVPYVALVIAEYHADIAAAPS